MKESILYRTGQAWKFWVAVYGMLLSTLPVLVAEWFRSSLLAGYHMLLVGTGMLIAISGFAFGCVAIKCPACGARWFWLAVIRKHNIGWFDWLFSQSVCPMCEDNGEFPNSTAS